MADSKEGEVYWHCPDPRAIIPLENTKKPKSLRKSEEKYEFEYRVDTDFKAVITKCADRDDTWISDEIIETYTMLHELGSAHSVETYIDNELVGGLYGVSVGGAFFGESMFSKRRDTSKMALAWLTDRLRETGFILMDTQFLTAHLKSMGGVEISRAKYLKKLEEALSGKPANITALNSRQSPQDVIQRNAQTS